MCMSTFLMDSTYKLFLYTHIPLYEFGDVYMEAIAKAFIFIISDICNPTSFPLVYSVCITQISQHGSSGYKCNGDPANR